MAAWSVASDYCSFFWRRSTLTCIALGLTLYYAIKPYLGGRRFPPGPMPLPFIGHTYALFSRNLGKFRYDKWKHHGNVVSFTMPGLMGWYVDLIGYKAIHEAFVTRAEQLSDRPMEVGIRTLKKPGLVFGSPHNWRLLRSHAVMVLKDHGLGRSSMEPRVAAEIARLTAALNQLAGPSQSSEQFSYFVMLAVSNITNEVIFGRRLEYDEELAISLTHFPLYFLQEAKYSSLFIFKILPWDVTGYRHYRKHYDICKEFFMSEISQRKANLDIENPHDYIESFLAQGIKTGEACFNDDDELFSCISQLYIAGSDTTATTLTWMAFYLINYPEVQEKIYREVCEVIGDRTVSLSDRPKMHYTQAVIWELLRVTSFATATLPHYCNDDTIVDGRLIPKGAVVQANLWSVNHNESVFANPEEFLPERFLSGDSEFDSSSTKLVLPFGIGKRMCSGADFAKTMLFMFMVTIVQRFKLSRITEEKLPVRGFMGLGNTSEPFDMIIHSR